MASSIFVFLFTVNFNNEKIVTKYGASLQVDGNSINKHTRNVVHRAL